MTRLTALGDSFSCGEGVGVQVPLDHTWAALLARSLDLPFTSLALPGARVGDVLRTQLPGATGGEIATVFVGLNDVGRTGFDRNAVRQGLLTIATQLRQRFATVLVVRLHDPTRMFRVPAPIRGLAQARRHVVNEMIETLTQYDGVRVLDLERVSGLQSPGAWAVDRIHPSGAGHVAIATAAFEVLADAGYDGSALPFAPVSDGPSRWSRLHWLVRYGAPYVAVKVAVAAASNARRRAAR